MLDKRVSRHEQAEDEEFHRLPANADPNPFVDAFDLGQCGVRCERLCFVDVWRWGVGILRGHAETLATT